ncbi:MAG: glycerate kinase [Actinobacteria bacterium]|nr:glycerate kinase [Actinomycetota bacterium]
MRVVVAPDKFAGTMSAADAADTIAAGWCSTRPDDEVLVVPMADGGAGTLDVVATAVAGAERVEAEVADARGRARAAHWLALPDGRALLEAAEACGLAWLDEDDRDPRCATSYGVGQLIAAATDAGVREILIGLGGSATSDGGAGMALALGHRLLRADGNGVKVGAEHLVELARVEPVAAGTAPVTIVSDVTNPLLGPDGAVAVFAPQKGAGPADLPVLEDALRRFADVVERDLPGGPWRELPGAGAAGGLGFGLLAFCGGRMADGAEVVAGLVDLDARMRSADVVIAGEGKLDDQTLSGKTPAFVAQRARAAGARVLAIAGQVEGRGAELFDEVAVLGEEGLDRPVELTRQRAAELASTM